MEILLIWIGLAVATAAIADAKGRSAFGWLVAGVLFGVFALIVVAVIPAIRTPDS